MEHLSLRVAVLILVGEWGGRSYWREHTSGRLAVRDSVRLVILRNMPRVSRDVCLRRKLIHAHLAAERSVLQLRFRIPARKRLAWLLTAPIRDEGYDRPCPVFGFQFRAVFCLQVQFQPKLPRPNARSSEHLSPPALGNDKPGSPRGDVPQNAQPESFRSPMRGPGLGRRTRPLRVSWRWRTTSSSHERCRCYTPLYLSCRLADPLMPIRARRKRCPSRPTSNGRKR